ncbi:MAG: transporter ATP-binding protein [Clostridia bacterium]|nr:transporter ATP-binding protein [Clostridia bacterium]
MIYIAEAIAMADEVAVLSKRPATIKSTHEIKLTVEGEKTPLMARRASEFKDYFETLWKELDVDGK